MTAEAGVEVRGEADAVQGRDLFHPPGSEADHLEGERLPIRIHGLHLLSRLLEAEKGACGCPRDVLELRLKDPVFPYAGTAGEQQAPATDQ